MKKFNESNHQDQFTVIDPASMYEEYDYTDTLHNLRSMLVDTELNDDQKKRAQKIMDVFRVEGETLLATFYPEEKYHRILATEAKDQSVN